MKNTLPSQMDHTQSWALILSLCLFVLATGIQAQNLNVRGRVVDMHGQPVAGAKAQLLKNHGLDSTDSAGKFSITSSVGTFPTSPAVAPGTLTFSVKKNCLLFENSRMSGFEFELFSLNGRRVYVLKQPDLLAGKHLFACPLDGFSTGIYIARIHFPGFQISKAVACVPKLGWQYATAAGEHSLPENFLKKTAAADSLMVYKKGFRVLYVPLETYDINLGDLVLNSDTNHNEKYIIIFRDSLTDVFPAVSGWEFDPARKTFTKKHDFAPSTWAPGLLLSEKTPEYLRHQVNSAPYEYYTLLYKINYCTWKVDTLLRSQNILGLGENPAVIYLYTDKGNMTLDKQTGRLDTMESFNIVWRFGDLWLVQHKNADTAYFFSPAENRITKTLHSSDKFGGYDQYVLSSDKRFMAQSKAINGTLPWCLTVSRKTQIILFSLDNDSIYRYPVTIYSAGGSGLPVIYLSRCSWFSNDGCFNYISALQENDTLGQGCSDSGMVEGCELISINLQTQASTRQPATAAMFAAAPPPAFNPPFLPPYLDSLRGKLSDEPQLVKEFLGLFGITPSWQVWGMSPNGKRFFGKFGITEGASASSAAFYFGDMENRWVERLPDPGNRFTGAFTEMHIHWVADTCNR
jgi:hypothetical protein